MTFVKNGLSEQTIYQVLISTKLFEGLSNSALKPMIISCTHLAFSEGDIISHEGTTLNACPLILDGEIEVLRNTYLGDEKIFGIFSRHELVAIAAVFMPHNRYPMTLRAKTHGSALLLDKRSILQVCEENPIVMKRLLIRFSSKLYEHVNHIDWLTSSSAEQRLAAYLLSLQREQRTIELVLPITRGQLATKLGIRYETLSRLLSNWRNKQIIDLNGYHIKLKQITYLDQLVSSAKRSF